MTAPWGDLGKPGHFNQGGEWEALLDYVGGAPFAHLRQTAGQSIANGGDEITFDTHDVDNFGGHSTTTLTTRYTAQTSGWYQLSGGVCFVANATGRRGGWWMKNGSIVSGSESIQAAHASTIDVPMRTIFVNLTVNDWVEFFAYQDSGGALNTSAASAQQHATMSIRWIALA